MENVLFRRGGTLEGEAGELGDAADRGRERHRRGEVLRRRDDRDSGFGVRNIWRLVGSDRRGDRRETGGSRFISSAARLDQSFSGSSDDSREPSRSRSDGRHFQGLERAASEIDIPVMAAGGWRLAAGG